MTLFHTPLPTGATSDPDRIATFLRAKNYALVDGVSVSANNVVFGDCDRDPSADLATYVDTPTPAEQAVITAISYLKTTYLPFVLALAPASRTPEQRALLAILQVLKAQLTP